ncbi:MAG: site-2 protease family protein [Solirubrobacterales bacterium]
MLGGRSIPLVRIFGIRIGVDPSWFLALFLFIWWLTDYYQAALPGGEDGAAFALATASALLFFLSILLHELGHAVVAIRNGISIAGIDLWLFGGIAKMSQDTSSPGVEFRVAIAGPVVTFLIAILCAGLGILSAGGASEYWNAVAFDAESSAGGFVAMMSYLASINIVLLLFNMIPAFPLDGGRVARAIAWKLTGDRTRATNFAATLGRGFAYILIGGGIFWAFQIDFIGGIWMVFIGMFLGQAARSATYQTAVLSRIEGVRVADVMDDEPIAIPADMTIGHALHEYFLRYRYEWFPVVDGAGRFVGIVDRERAERIPDDRQPVFTVREILRTEEDNLRVRSDDPLEALLGRQALMRVGALMAVDDGDRLLGVVTWDQVRRALQQGTAGAASR